MSRRFHWDRFYDLMSGNGLGLNRWETARLCWHHLCGLVRP